MLQSQSPADEPQTDGDAMAGPTHEEIAAQLKTVSAETDTKIARLDGKRLLATKMDNVNENTLAIRREVKDSERAVKANTWVIFGAIAVRCSTQRAARGQPAVIHL
jgi:hypothetical protein